MKLTPALVLSAFCICALAFMAGCKKDPSPNPDADKLQGKWELFEWNDSLNGEFKNYDYKYSLWLLNVKNSKIKSQESLENLRNRTYMLDPDSSIFWDRKMKTREYTYSFTTDNDTLILTSPEDSLKRLYRFIKAE